MMGKELPRVSVMIPTYNQESCIATAVESALMQDYPNLEVIVSDDCSTDGTKGVVERYLADDRLTYYRNKKNLGRIGNYRKSLYERVTGDWALNLDGDDRLYGDGVISRMASAILEHPNQDVVAVMGSTVTVNSVVGMITKSPEYSNPGLFKGIDVFLSWDKRSFHHLAVLYKAALAREIDYYRLDTIMSDCESVLRLILNGNVVVVDDIIGVWNIHGNNTSSSESIADAIEDYSYIEEAYKYALERGADARQLRDWRKTMVKFHTRGILRSSIPVSRKVGVLVPYLLKNYPFALTGLLSLKSLALGIAGIHPASYRRARRLYSKFRGKDAWPE
jgi:glycosyltransferase involved in cell wall biosynthesis